MDWIDRKILMAKASARRSTLGVWAGAKTRANLARQATQGWLVERQSRILLGLSAVVFLVAVILPQGWVRSTNGLVVVNLINFFVRGVLVPEAIFFGALALGWIIRLPGARLHGLLAVGTAWYLGVFVGSVWLFFVEHVQGSIATSFVDVLSAERLTAFLGLIASPWRAVGFHFDFPVMVAAATTHGEHVPDVVVMWRNFVLLAIATYAVLPRVLLSSYLLAKHTWAAVQGALRMRATTPAKLERDLHYERPPLSGTDSLNWFRSIEDEAMLTKALILTVVGRDQDSAQLPGIAAMRGDLEGSLNDKWRTFYRSTDEWKAYLPSLSTDMCPKLEVLAFDVLRFNYMASSPDGQVGFAVDRAKMRRALIDVLAHPSVNWLAIDTALADVERFEAELSKDQDALWKRMLCILGVGAVAGAGAVACAPFLGASACAMVGLQGVVAVKAGLAALGGGKVVLGVVGTVAGGMAGKVATDEGQTPVEERVRFLVGYLARSLALITSGVAPQQPQIALEAWLQALATAKPSGSATDSAAVRQEAKVAKRALGLIRQRTSASFERGAYGSPLSQSHTPSTPSSW